jgi:hypothetical protein
LFAQCSIWLEGKDLMIRGNNQPLLSNNAALFGNNLGLFGINAGLLKFSGFREKMSSRIRKSQVFFSQDCDFS